MRQKAIVIDIDGTLANTPYPLMVNGVEADLDGWIKSTRFSPANVWCQEIVCAMFFAGYKIIFLTARSDSPLFKTITEQWISTNINVPHELLMRTEGDSRPDHVIKSEILMMKLLPYYDIEFAIDDKRVNIEVFRNMGIPALHCADF